MASYNTVITNEGAALLASVIANQGTLTFSEMRFSTTDYDGVEQTLTVGTFGGVFITAAAAGSVVDATTIKVGAQFDNSGIVGDHPLYSIGIVGTDGNTTALIAVCTTTNPDIIRAALTGVSTYAFNVNLAVSSTSNITVTGTTAGVQYENLSNPITIDGNVETTVESALGALNTYSDKIKDNLTGRNLLDNGWFTVNQRGWTSGVGIYNQYCVDRWKMTYGNVMGTIEVTANGLHITPDTVGDRTTLYQPFESDVYAKLNGKTFTFSALMSDGTIYSGTKTLDTSNDITFFENTKIKLLWVTGYKCFRFDVLDEITIRAVKVEVGTVSTLHLDVAPDPTTELLKCQRFFIRLTATTAGQPLFYGMCESTTDSTFALMLPTAMRTSPTFTYAGSWGIYEGTSDYPLTLFYLGTCYPQNIYFATRIGSSVLTKGQCVCVRSGASGDYIELSADL